MAVQCVQQNQPFLQRHETKVKKTVEAALAILTSVQDFTSPVKHYFATRFIERSLKTLSDNGVFCGADPGIAWHDLAIYSCVLWMIRPFVPNAQIFAILSSPSVARKLMGNPLFQRLREAVRNIEFAQVRKIVWNLIKEELWIPEIDHLQGRGLDWREYTEAPRDFIRRKQQMAGELFEDVRSLALTARDKGPLPFTEEVADRVHAMSHQFGDLTNLSIYPLLFGNGITRPTLYPRIMAAWGLSGEIHPALSPVLFTSRTPDLVELGVRGSGALLTYGTNAPLLCTFGTEMALRLIPDQIRNHPLNQEALAGSRECRQECNRLGREFRRMFREVLRETGASEKNIDRFTKIFTQIAVAFIYGELSSNSSPLLIAINTTYFCSYIGLLLAHQGINDGAVLASESGLESLPLKFTIGLTLAILGMLVDRPGGIAILAAMLSLPMVVDHIAKKEGYREQLKQIVEITLIPNIRSILRIKDNVLFAWELSERFTGMIPEGRIRSALNWAKLSAVGAGGRMSFQKLKRILQRPEVQEVLQMMRSTGVWTYRTVMKYETVRLLSIFVRTEITVLTNLIGQPRDLTTGTIAVIGMGVAATTASPFAATVAMETARPVLRSEGVRDFFRRSMVRMREIAANVMDELSYYGG